MSENLEQTEARQGETPGIARYVLVISTALAFVILIGLYFWYF